MKFDPKALLILIGLVSLFAIAVSSTGGDWVHAAEAVWGLVILVGIAGFLRGRGLICSFQ